MDSEPRPIEMCQYCGERPVVYYGPGGQGLCMTCQTRVMEAFPSSPSKPSNPKDIIGSDKLPLHLWPETATAQGCLGLLDGALKYGRSNWRAVGVRSSIYYDAARRHLDAWFEGENVDRDSGLHPLAHALACLAIIVDAEAAGLLNDDRQIKGGYMPLVAKLTPDVKRLKTKYQEKHPRHYTISDSVAVSPEPGPGSLLPSRVGTPE